MGVNPYHIIIAFAGLIIISFLFNIIARKTNIPSVLMLIGLGVSVQIFYGQSQNEGLMKILEVIGNVGLIFIVLEAALDLELKKEKIPIIFKSFFSALFSLLICAFVIAFLFSLFWSDANFIQLLLYAVPLSIMSSAIIIPSVKFLDEEKKEFMIYESTFSDILGIMFFYFLKDNAGAENTYDVVQNIVVNIGVTVVISIATSYFLVWLCKQLKNQTKYFLLFAVLLLLYAIGKQFHLSSLLIILFFGLVISNADFFSFGKLKTWFSESDKSYSNKELHTITLETAFVLRTVFFVLFGITIPLLSLVDISVTIISLCIIVILFLTRFVLLKLFIAPNKNIFPELWIAPRGLITILLFFGIPNDLKMAGFSPGILLYTILISSIIMAVALIKNKGGKVMSKELFKNMSDLEQPLENFEENLEKDLERSTDDFETVAKPPLEN